MRLRRLWSKPALKSQVLRAEFDQALKIIDRGDCDAAIIDANLAGVSAAPVALALLAQLIPFIVISGYSRDQQRGIFLGAPFVQKPCVPDDLIRAVRSLLVGGLVKVRLKI